MNTVLTIINENDTSKSAYRTIPSGYVSTVVEDGKMKG